VIAAEKSADGIVGGTSFAEGPNAGKMLGYDDLVSAMRLKIQVTGLLSDGKGVVRTASLEGTEAGTAKSLSEPLAPT
jgi:hypothetical protein